jgi:DHA1 family tetracycline resistance protein-like MFS transporter
MSASHPRRAALAFIFVTVLLDVLALGLIVPILPNLIVDFSGGDEATGARLNGLFGTVWAAMQLIFSPLFGSISDRFGRRKVILVSNFGLAFDYVVMALAPTWQWLLVGRVVSGITASSIPTAFAYIADVTPPEKRTASFGLVGAAFGLGFTVGPLMGGVLGQVNPRLPFWIAGGLSLCNGLYGLFVLPESLALDKRAPFSWARANPVGSLVLLLKHRGLLSISLVNFLGYVAHVVLPSTFVLYAGYRFQWNIRTVGLALFFVGIGSMVVQGLLIRPALQRLGERRTLLLGLVFGTIGFGLSGLAPSPPLFWLSLVFSSLWGLAGPAAMGLMAARVGPSEQGQLQGANNSLRAISELLGPSMFTLVFAYFISTGKGFGLPGAPFVLAALFLVASLALAVKVAVPAAKASEQVPVAPAEQAPAA